MQRSISIHTSFLYREDELMDDDDDEDRESEEENEVKALHWTNLAKMVLIGWQLTSGV